MRSDGFLIGILLACCFLLIGALALTGVEIQEYKHGQGEKAHSLPESHETPQLPENGEDASSPEEETDE